MQDFSELGEAFDEPVNTYSSGMRSRLQFALSLAFDFDIYISDEVTAAGDAAFRKKAAAAFKAMANRAGLIMVAHDEGTLKQFCQAGICFTKARRIGSTKSTKHSKHTRTRCQYDENSNKA